MIREILDLSKKVCCEIGERFFRNAAKEMGKKSHLVETVIKKMLLHEILPGRVPVEKR